MIICSRFLDLLNKVYFALKPIVFPLKKNEVACDKSFFLNLLVHLQGINLITIKVATAVVAFKLIYMSRLAV